jgi:hypothetical protein
MSPSNLSALRRLSAYNTDLGYQRIANKVDGHLQTPIPPPHDALTPRSDTLTSSEVSVPLALSTRTKTHAPCARIDDDEQEVDQMLSDDVHFPALGSTLPNPPHLRNRQLW